MPDVDQDGRQTYGESRGWSANKAPESTTPPADAAGASSPPDAAAPSAETSPSQEQISEQGTPPTTQPEPEKKWNQPPPERWDELRRERDDARRMADLALQRIPTPQAAPQRDPWDGKVNHPDPATAQFWQEQRSLMQHERAMAKQEALQEMMPVIDAGRAELAQIKIADFRKSNPEITPGSQDEQTMVAYMNGQMDGVKHPLESAKRNTLYDRLEAESRASKTKRASVPQKVAANTEASAGIPAGAGLPARRGDWRDNVGTIIDKGGSLRDVANTIFGKKRMP